MVGYKEHLGIGSVSAAIFLAILFIFGVNLNDGNLILIIVISTFVFSLLPDIDHKKANISGLLHLAALILLISMFTKVLKFNFSTILLIITMIGLELYHWKYAKNHHTHRQFPHTFTFGLIGTIIFFIITLSWIPTLVGMIVFTSHIIADDYLETAFKEDKILWEKILHYYKK